MLVAIQHATRVSVGFFKYQALFLPSEAELEQPAAPNAMHVMQIAGGLRQGQRLEWPMMRSAGSAGEVLISRPSRVLSRREAQDTALALCRLDLSKTGTSTFRRDQGIAFRTYFKHASAVREEVFLFLEER